MNQDILTEKENLIVNEYDRGLFGFEPYDEFREERAIRGDY